MGLLNKILRSTDNQDNIPYVKLGRFSDAFKSQDQLQRMEEGRMSWEQKDYLNALQATLDYLREPPRDQKKNS